MNKTSRLLSRPSFEIMPTETDRLAEAASHLPAGTQISITFLPTEKFGPPVSAASRIRELGFTPMPHISARRIGSETELEGFLAKLGSAATPDRVFLIAGDLKTPQGPYKDALTVIRSGVLARYGIGHVGIAGYPEGHPQIARNVLWRALLDKRKALREFGHDLSFFTQFGFDVGPAFVWLEELRACGVEEQVRIGVAGPATAKALLRFASRCGVSASARAMSKYGLSLGKLLNTAEPDLLIRDLEERLRPERHGDVRLHFYSFDGLAKTAAWAAAYESSRAQGRPAFKPRERAS